MKLQELNTEIKNKLEEAMNLMKIEGEKALGEAFKEFFEKVPMVKAVQWTQYTPYFNDGDPCVFWCGISDAAVLLEKDHGLPEDDFYLFDDEEEGWVEISYTTTSTAAAAINEFLLELSKIDDKIFEVLFGDHVQVTATLDGNFEVEEYGHD